MQAERRVRTVGTEGKRRDDAAAHADAVHPAQQTGEQGGQQRELDHGLFACRATSHTSSSTGTPISAVPVKKVAQP
jgi:hypothetical protein